MPRIALGLEYDGSAFAGWQAQLHAPSIQSSVQSALSYVANHPVNIICAGRTDAGVHATMQVVHFDTPAVRSERAWVRGVSTNMPDSISVLWTREVNEDFHARYSALARSYRYVILNRTPRPALLRERVCWLREPLDAERMHLAAQALVGEHDFSSLRAAECQSKSPIRRLYRIAVTRVHEYVVINVTANAFLHHMVRNIAGVLLAVGCGDQPVEWPAAVLRLRDRAQAGITAPASGLYLFGVHYPALFSLPSTAGATAWPPGPVLTEAESRAAVPAERPVFNRP
ncbi:MAG: tRNA pseudouridine(38-40) synthase TruA [Steroidobacteraceae bacterium]